MHKLQFQHLVCSIRRESLGNMILLMIPIDLAGVGHVLILVYVSVQIPVLQPGRGIRY
jgi:hypothetical protein